MIHALIRPAGQGQGCCSGSRAGICVYRCIAFFSAKRANVRLEGERLANDHGGDEGDIINEAQLVLRDACSLTNVSSQVAGKRPVQGAAISPDNSTLATADWNGIVSFWSLDDNITSVKSFQVCAQT
jgi:WD40 repeat protein